MKRLRLGLTGLLLLAGCNFLFDHTPPTITITSPTAVSTVRGTVTITVQAVDDESGIRSITVLINGQMRDSITFNDDPLPRGAKSFSYEWDTTKVPDGAYVISAGANNGVAGQGVSIDVAVTTANGEAAPPAEPTVSIDARLISPPPTVSEVCTDPNGCFGGSISVPVRVEAPITTSLTRVDLIINSAALGTRTLTSTTAPFFFSFDTNDYPVNDRLTLQARAETAAGGSRVSDPVSITVFNPAPPPILAITSPTSGAKVSGDLFVSVSVQDLRNSGYSLDVNGNGTLDSNEGFLVELIDFANIVVGQRHINQVNTPNLAAANDGSYTTAEAIDTTQLASDTYTIRVTIPLRHQPTGATISLTRSIQIDTFNVNRVPPSLLILAPTNEGPGDVKVIRDPVNAYVTVQATDNTGLAFIELRMFQGDADADTTPSRFIYASPPPGETFTTVAIPMNFNATPYLPNFNRYTVRIIAEDRDGNRAFQDVLVALERGAAGGYTLRQTLPVVGEPPRVVNPVRRNTVVTLSVSGLVGGERFDHFMRAPGDAVFRPLLGVTGVQNATYVVGLPEVGAYFFLTQVTRSDGSIYLTGFESIGVVDQ